ncbi:3'-5' exonuclease [Breznakia pachnodae]|uniref:DNA polymerase III epsilon subunit family exonuclease n=1 Tax=Breznakia pachnodae TaxID=265178 RepID=A0ABU0DY20_9FIRM|nr:3'-5' exonuclease [Breznakia pachnodae]MDQ0359536.1 DNA polymerase III epsilon subunit family exonuclease [Breznakia pachnodae]
MKKYIPKNSLKGCYKEKGLFSLPTDYIVFDTETTGTDPYTSRVIEIGAIKYRNLEKIEEFNMLINPEEAISSFITQLTGIRNNDVVNQPTIDIVLKDFYDFVGKLPLIAHNAIFDIQMIAGEAYRCDMSFLQNEVIDTVPMARVTIPKPWVENHKLETIKNFLGLANGSHRALDDCETCNCIYQLYYDKNTQKK